MGFERAHSKKFNGHVSLYPSTTMDGENLYETYKNLTQNCYTVANSAIKITSSDTTSFSILSKNLATSVEHILEHV